MERHSGEIRIPDLANPQLTPGQRAAIAYGETQRPSLREAEVLEAARKQSGLSDFGAEDFRPRLRAWLQAARGDSELNALNRMLLHEDCVRILVNRLRLEDLLRRHPEILEIPISRPIIIAGLPRSGTTHLVGLLGADTRLRSLPYWESREPIPARGEGPGRDGLDPRWLRCQQSYEAQLEQMPLLRAMHDMPPEHIHEEIELLNLDFWSYHLEWLACVPGWRDFYLAQDPLPRYAYLKKALQALQWLRGGERWVLKTPQHLEWLPALHATFPDATIAITHRDPVSVIQSAITMLAYSDRSRRQRVDLAGLAEYWSDRVERLLRACVRDREALPAAQSLDVLFHEFMADDLAMVERIYERAELSLPPETRAEIAQALDENPRGRHGRIRYDLRGDFGIEPGALRERFAFYFERFPVRAED